MMTSMAMASPTFSAASFQGTPCNSAGTENAIIVHITRNMGYKNVGSAVTHAQAHEGSRSGKHGKRELNTA